MSPPPLPLIVKGAGPVIVAPSKTTAFALFTEKVSASPVPLMIRLSLPVPPMIVVLIGRPSITTVSLPLPPNTLICVTELIAATLS